jgi:flagellar basal body-associated protein FliL
VLFRGIPIAFSQSMPAEQQARTRASVMGRGLTVALAAFVLVAIGIWFRARHGSESATPAGEETQIKSTLHLDTFVLNLADPDQRSYLRVGIDLGLNRELKRDEVVPVAQVRDVILGVLSQAKVDELLTAAGKTRLKESLLHSLRERVPGLGVEEIYFTEFLIQR